MSPPPLLQRASFPCILFALVGLTFGAVRAQGEVIDFSYKTLDTRIGQKFLIAFWQDPDLSQLGFTYESFREKLRRFTRELESELREPLIEAGFGDIQISIIDDYDSLVDERNLGRFHLLHCDPAVYLLPRYESLEPYPYTVLLEEADREESTSSNAVIWVKKDSPIQSPRDLINEKIVSVHPSSLFGGALQRAWLWDSPFGALRDGREYASVQSGAVSEGVLRLVTSLGTEDPVEAAFLPREGIGFQVAAQMLGLKRVEDIPIRTLEIPSSEFPLPGNPLLIDRNLLEKFPDLGEQIRQFFIEQKLPWDWISPQEADFSSLEDRLSPLLFKDGNSP
ncbi:MAG: PhnD/SsuA/transferrin family substrate-binding protein [Candidatus Omnitrophica bacterium]|nr:PhnD/SsuA/transferrin family substrate-binding protein [Candidatus Omnitrophota bacterium]